MYSTEAAVPATADAIRNLFVAQGWVPYGKAGDSDVFKQNASAETDGKVVDRDHNIDSLWLDLRID
jgi:hypothetical protein